MWYFSVWMRVDSQTKARLWLCFTEEDILFDFSILFRFSLSNFVLVHFFSYLFCIHSSDFILWFTWIPFWFTRVEKKQLIFFMVKINIYLEKMKRYQKGGTVQAYKIAVKLVSLSSTVSSRIWRINRIKSFGNRIPLNYFSFLKDMLSIKKMIRTNLKIELSKEKMYHRC